jgi:hypothetical protein
MKRRTIMKKSGTQFKIWRLAIVLGILFTTGTMEITAEKSDFAIHGYISQGFLYSNHNNFLAETKKGTFQFNELGINFSTEPGDKLRIGLQLAARDLGDLGNDKVNIDWAYADYHWRDWLGIRVGKIKIPMGFYNKTRDIDMLRTPILLPQSIYSETDRDTANAVKGIGLYGNFSLHALGDISYEIQLGTMELDKISSTAKHTEISGLLKVDKFNPGTSYIGAVTWETPLPGLRLGATGEYIPLKTSSVLARDITVPVPSPPYTLIIAPKGTPVTADTPDTIKIVYSLEYIHGDLTVAAEYGRLDNETTTRIPGLEPMIRKVNTEIFYGSVCYRWNDWLETEVYYSIYYKDRNDRSGTQTPYTPPFSAFQKDTCLSLRFDLNDHWTFKMEGHLMDGTGFCFPQDNRNPDGVLEFEKNWYLLAAKMTFFF